MLEERTHYYCFYVRDALVGGWLVGEECSFVMVVELCLWRKVLSNYSRYLEFLVFRRMFICVFRSWIEVTRLKRIGVVEAIERFN